jgi:hypothetical protein
MQKEHQIYSQDKEEEDREGRGDIRDVLYMQRQVARGAFVTKTKHELFKGLLLDWIVNQNVPLSAVKRKSFRYLLTVLSSDVDHFLPKSGSTVQSWLMHEFGKKREESKSSFART